MALEASLARFLFGLDVQERATSVGIGNRTSRYEHRFEFNEEYVFGTGTNKIGAVYSDRVSLGSAVQLDLSGSLTSVLDGSVVSFPILMGIFLRNLSTTTGEAIVVGGGSDGAGTAAVVNWVSAANDEVVVGPGGMLALWSPVDGYAVTNSTADILRLEAASGSPSADVLIVGRAS